MTKHSKITWTYCQNNSDKILADAIWVLLDSTVVPISASYPVSPGVYLFSNSKKYYYIGQADNIRNRLKQQLSKRSTFYKNYLESNMSKEELGRGDFNLRLIEANIGRKEIEEFGMVNLETKLNKFHKNKRSKFPIRSEHGLFLDVAVMRGKLLNEGETQLFSSNPKPWKQAKPAESPGIYYVLDKKGELIYLGESTDMNRRHHMHSNRTYISALRRHIGTEVFGFKFIAKKKFSDRDDQTVTKFLDSCKISWMPISFGRLELEEFLIKKHQPILNRKSK